MRQNRSYESTVSVVMDVIPGGDWKEKRKIDERELIGDSDKNVTFFYSFGCSDL